MNDNDRRRWEAEDQKDEEEQIQNHLNNLKRDSQRRRSTDKLDLIVGLSSIVTGLILLIIYLT